MSEYYEFQTCLTHHAVDSWHYKYLVSRPELIARWYFDYIFEAKQIPSM